MFLLWWRLLNVLLMIQAINQNGGFTKVWVSLKTIYFPVVLAVLAWYWRRVHMLSRPPALLEYMLLALGSALTFLNRMLSTFLWYLSNILFVPYIVYKSSFYCIFSSIGIFNTCLWYAVYASLGWYSTRNILCNIIVILACICRRTSNGKRVTFFLFFFLFYFYDYTIYMIHSFFVSCLDFTFGFFWIRFRWVFFILYSAFLHYFE